MKKYILSPLCSALVIPGLGQVINHNLRKGVIILSIVFLLFIGGTVKLVFIIHALVNHPKVTPNGSGNIMERLQGEDLSSLIYLLIAFAIVWIYSVLDAFWTGRKMENQGDTI